MLTVISSRQEIAKCQHQLFRRLAEFKTGQKDFYLGTRGGGQTYLVSYSEELSIWWFKGFANNENRYWNAFGMGGSPDTLTQDHFIEINYPLEGINRRVAAIWAKDEWGRISLLHSGKMGGGKKGFTKGFFFANYRGGLTSVNFEDGIEEYVLIGGLEDKRFPYQIAQYVNEVYRIKALPTWSKPKTHASSAGTTFNPEFSGKKKPYGLDYEVEPNCDHGLVVNELAKYFKSKKLKYRNDKRKDIFILNANNEHTHLFEIKTAVSLQCIYTAIGQLFLNSQNIAEKPSLVFVCPDEIPEGLVADLKSLKITTVTFSWNKGIPVFKGLNRML